MNKKLKILISCVISVVLILCIVIGAFFAIFPMNPKVEIKDATKRLNQNDKLTVASFNTAAPWGNLIKGTFTTRRACLFANEINEYLPDTLGVQEINSKWVARMETLLPQYEFYGVKRGGDGSEDTSEMSGIFYLKEKYELIESNTFWISETPETESHFDGAGCNRICSYVVLKNKNSGNEFVHFNTHLDNVSEDAQNLGGKLISEYATKICEKYGDIPVVITGDFNQYSDGLGCKALEEKDFLNVGKSFEKDNLLTWNDWSRETDGRPIDFIFINDKLSANNYDVIHYESARQQTSDHYMIISELQFN